MIARATQRTRTNEWKSSTAASPASVFSITTDDPSLTAMLAPVPTLALCFDGKSSFRPAATRGELARQPLDAAVAAASLPRQAPPPGPPAEPAEAERHAEAQAHRIEMTIDSLPHHVLTEPIPIAIDPLGDTTFTASMINLDIEAIGSSVGEALVLLKEKIEFVYEDLNRRMTLSADQKTMLQMLHTYVPPHARKPEWL